MFGISFGEMLMVGLVALLVIGPTRLPEAARTTGLWAGRLKRAFDNIKQDVEREIGMDEIRRQLHNENILLMEQRQRAEAAMHELMEQVTQPLPGAQGTAPELKTLPQDNTNDIESAPAESMPAGETLQPAEKADQARP